jgi:RIO-like serine/threonine protein kinase
MVIVVAHEVLSDIESLHEKGDFRGDVARFYNIIASCAATRPVIDWRCITENCS